MSSRSRTIRTIVVGAGSGGGVVAARLVEDPHSQVELIEAGPYYSASSDLPPDLQDAENASFTDHDWGFKAYYTEPADSRPALTFPRGRVVGGSSAVNATIAQRGNREDFDAWAAAGNDDWAWSEVLPFYQKLERDLDFGSDPVHGADGPVPIMRYPRSEWPSAVLAFERACLDRGMPAVPDSNAQRANGVGPIPRNQQGSLRASTLLTYLQPAQERENLTVRANTRVRRVVFDGRRALGVEVDGPTGREFVEADRVVLCAGAIQTPQLLMLSGVGPRAVLEGMSLSVVAPSEGVGRNLQDHQIVSMATILRDRDEPRFGCLALARFSSPTGTGDLTCVPALLRASTLSRKPDTDATVVFVMSVAIAGNPKSSGWVTLSSDDPTCAPEIHLNFMDDPDDVARMMYGVRFIYDIAMNSSLKDQIEGGVLSLDEHTINDDRALEAYVRNRVYTGYHPAGTCRMGPSDDSLAVVDQRLKVRGVDGLFIADASIMPNITTSFTNISTYLIGERAAAWLRSDSRP